MLDYLLEEPCEDYKTSVWNMEWLKWKFNHEVVQPLMKQGWAHDEIMAGVSAMYIEDEIWGDYEQWAEEYILKMEPV